MVVLSSYISAKVGSLKTFVLGPTLEQRWMQPPHFPLMGKNIMPPGSAPALGGQLSCCLAVKPFLTVTGSTWSWDKAGREVGATQEGLPGPGASTVTACHGSALISHARLLFRPLMTLPVGVTINSPWQTRRCKLRLGTGPTSVAQR